MNYYSRTLTLRKQMMNKSIVLLMLFLFCVLIPQISDADDHTHPCDAVTQAEIDAALEAAPWESITHSHDNYGEHTHDDWVRQVEFPAGCGHIQTHHGEHPAVEPAPEKKEIPVIEGYTNPSVLVCIAGPCLDKEKPNQVIGPTDIHGNVPPEPEPGDPEIFYPIVEIDGVNYWDSTQEPYQVSEAAENTDTTPEGYRLEDIDGQLFLVPFGDTQERVPAEASEDTSEQETFIIYRHVEVEGGQDYLEPTPFHAHPVDGVVDDSVADPDPTDAASQEGQDSQGMQQGLDIQDGASETFVSLDGKFYQVTSNPAIPLRVTEYMVRTWGSGQETLPQWIEIYNPNTLAVNLFGYEFTYVLKKDFQSIRLRHFLIPPQGVIILVTHIPLQRHRYEGISESQVYNLNIENRLKQGWSFKDPLGSIISQTGKRFGEKENPIQPERVGISRVSYNVYASEPTRAAYFFGFRRDVSTPGYYEPKIPRSPALLRQRLKTTWAALKRDDR